MLGSFTCAAFCTSPETESCLGWKGPQEASKSDLLPKARPALALNQAAQSLKSWACTTSLGSQLKCFTTFRVKKLLLISSQNVPCFNLCPFSFVFPLGIAVKNLSGSPRYSFCRYKQAGSCWTS